MHKRKARQSRVADEVDTHPNEEGPWFRRPQVSQFSGQSAITILPTISPNNNGCLEQSVQIHKSPVSRRGKAAWQPKKKGSGKAQDLEEPNHCAARADN